MMMNRIEEVEYAGIGALKDLLGPAEVNLLEGMDAHVLYTGTARAALRIILEYLTLKGNLQDRNSLVLTNQWLCQSVLYTMHRHCHPTWVPSDGVKAVMAYHQYGFPQNLTEVAGYCEEHGLPLIEDCANVWESFYQGKRLGTFGLASIFSFSKLYPTLLGGALVTRDADLARFAQDRIRGSKSPWLTYGSRLLFECLRHSAVAPAARDIQEMVYATTDTHFRIAPLSLRIVAKQLHSGALERRRANYLFVLDHFSDRPEYFHGLEREGVIPYVAPLFAPAEALDKIRRRLADGGVATGIYHFDVNRNVFAPEFKKCLWIPIHQGLSISNMERICSLIRNAA